jgi:hypothetical protein
VASGMTEIGGCTVTGLALIAEADETAFLAATAGTAIAASVPELPSVGEWCEAGALYDYNGALVICRQSHFRTIYPPEETLALFIVYREDTGVLDWIPDEQVHVGTRRMFDSTEYECLQPHVTQADWTPPAVPALWRAVVAPSAEWQPYVAYVIGDEVTHAILLYRCRQSHTSLPGWEPPNVPALWLPL